MMRNNVPPTNSAKARRSAFHGIFGVELLSNYFETIKKKNTNLNPTAD